MPVTRSHLGSLLLVLAILMAPSAEAVSSRTLGAPDEQVCVSHSPTSTDVNLEAPGRWNNPNRPGTGWDFSFAENGTTVEAFWYTFRDDGRPEWLSTGPIQWKVEGFPFGAISWTAPLFRRNLVSGQPAVPQPIGAVSFRRYVSDPHHLAVRWQLNGQSQFEEECLVDRSEAGFDGPTLSTQLSQGWIDPGTAQYRVQWVVEPSRNGDLQQWLERPDLLTHDTAGQPMWLTARKHVSIVSHASTTQVFTYRYYVGLYPGGRPTQAARDSCNAQRDGCARWQGDAGDLTRTALSNGQIDWSLNIHQLLAEPQSPVLQRNNVQATPAAPGPRALVDRSWCPLFPERDNCPVIIELKDGGSTHELVRVDMATGVETDVVPDQAGVALDLLPAGQYRFEIRRVAGFLSSSSNEGEGASIEIKVGDASDPPPEVYNVPCVNGYPASGPDYCENDDVYQTWAFTIGPFLHDFNPNPAANPPVDLDLKNFVVRDNYSAYIRFEPGVVGDLSWKYQLIRHIGPNSQETISQGLLGGFWYQNIPVPPRTDGFDGATTYFLKMTAADPAFAGVESRYSLSLFGGGYDPVHIGEDEFEGDNGPAPAKTIANGDIQLRNFHNSEDRDWIRLTVNPGDVHELTFTPEQPITGNRHWGYRIYDESAVHTQHLEEGGFSTVPVTKQFTHPGGVDPIIYYIEIHQVPATQFYGAESVYRVSLETENNLNLTPDDFDQQLGGDNSQAAASALTPGMAQVHNFHVGADEDWMHYLATQAGSTLAFQITPTDPNSTAAAFQAQLWTENELGDPVQLQASQGAASFGYPGVTLTQVSGFNDQPYWLQMSSGQLIGDPSEYVVTLTVTPPAAQGDAYEPDDSDSTSSGISHGSSQIHDFHTPNDPDWVHITLQPGQTAHFQLQGSSPGLNWVVTTYLQIADMPQEQETLQFGATAITASVSNSYTGNDGYPQQVWAKVYPIDGSFHGDGSQYSIGLQVEEAQSQGSADWLDTTVEQPPTPSNPTVPAHPPQVEVGTTPGQFRVDESGNATYSIPIYIAPATGGVAPELALNYSSGGGYGSLGVGFSVSGGSAITRCRKSVEAGDGPGPHKNVTFDDNLDAFCLDGQRLLEVGAVGSYAKVYRTELDGLANVAAFSEPGGTTIAYWSVWGKDGTQRLYGLSGASNSVAACSTPTGLSGNCNGRQKRNQLSGGIWSTDETRVIAWHLSKILSRDPAVGVIEYAYDIDNLAGEVLLRQITYSGTQPIGGTLSLGQSSAPTAYVRLNYEDATRQTISFMVGSRITHSKRLKDIHSYTADGVLGRSYSVTYEEVDIGLFNNGPKAGSGRERVTAIREYAVDESSYPSTTFEWSENDYEFGVKYDDSPALFTSLHNYKVGDVNGDGRQDIVWVSHNTDSNGQAPIRIALADPIAGEVRFVPVTQNVLTVEFDAYDPAQSWQLFDFNQDGRDDLLLLDSAGTGTGSGTWNIHLSHGNAFDTNAVVIPIGLAFAGGSNADSKALSVSSIADFNGDGLIDLLTAFRDTDGAIKFQVNLMKRAPQVPQPVGQVQPYSCPAGDVTANCPYYFDEARTVALTLPPGGANVVLKRRHLEKHDAFDLNGDGYADLKLGLDCLSGQANCVDGNYRGAWVPTTNYSVVSELPPPPPPPELGAEPEPQPRMVVPQTNDYWAIFTSAGVTAGPGQINFHLTKTWQSDGLGATVSGKAEEFRVADMNGDGLADVVYKASNGEWQVEMNVGDDFDAPICVGSVMSCVQGGDSQKVHLYDANSDGLVDFWIGSGVYFGDGRGRFEGSSNALSGFGLDQQEDRELRAFVDLDGDGLVDVLDVPNYYPDGQGNNSPGVYSIQRRTTPHQPREVVQKITNGLGVETIIQYAPMSFSSVYKRDRASAYRENWGRGSPVFDLHSAQQLVQFVSSSAPNVEPGSPSQYSSVAYRYAGARAQGGARGSLGMRKVWSFDLQTMIETETEYHQRWPFSGRAKRTLSHYMGALPSIYGACGTAAGSASVNGDLPQCQIKPMLCEVDMTPNVTIDCDVAVPPGVLLSQMTDELGARVRTSGSTLSTTVHSSDAQPAIPLSTGDRPLFVYQRKSLKLTYELDSQLLTNAGQIATEESVFEGTSMGGTSVPGYDGHGNLTQSVNETYSNTGTLLQSVHSQFTYTPGSLDAIWVPGLLQSSTVTTTRGSEVKTRRSEFEYESYGAVKVERIQPTGSLSERLNVHTIRNSNALPIARFSCSGHFTDSQCTAHSVDSGGSIGPSGLIADPSDPLSIRRFERMRYDGKNRFVEESFAPFDSGPGQNSAASIRSVSRVLSRNLYGEPTAVIDANGVEARTAHTGMGRAYHSYTVNSGSATETRYRWCARPTNVDPADDVTLAGGCPAGALYRIETVTSGAPTTRVYHDLLGRVILTESQAFETGQWNASATGYDRLGRVIQSSEAYRSNGNSLQLCPTTGCTLVSFDVLGRSTQVTHPDHTLSRPVLSKTRYQTASCPVGGALCLRQAMTDAKNQTSYEFRDALGELVRTVDAMGLAVDYSYDAHGNLKQVKRMPNNGDSAGQVITTTTTFDDLGRRTGLNDPDMGVWQYQYNAAGESVAEINANGQCIRSLHDVQGRVHSRIDYLSSSCSGAVQNTSSWQYDLVKIGLPGSESDSASGTVRQFEYDSLSRPVATQTSIRMHGSASSRQYRQEQTYDQYARPFQSLDLVFAAGDEHAISGSQARKVGVRFVYNSQGHQSSIVNAQLTSDVYYEVLATNGRGQITQDRRGATAALARNLHFDLKTGRLIGIESGQLGAIQDLDYGRTQGNAVASYDVLGNLLHREDRRTGLKETFSYDALSRLRSTARSQSGNPLGTQWFHYDQLGNFINKGGSEFLTGGLSYRNGNYSGIAHSCARSSVGPHMVTRVSGASGETRYCYDANGNQVSAGDGNPNSSAAGQRLISYAVHDKPLTITTTGSSGVRSTYAYGPGREIIKRVDAGAPGSSSPNVVTSEVDYIGGLEVHYLPDQGSVTQRREYRRHLANYLVITLKSQRNSGVLARSSTRVYRFEEKLGSIDVLADGQGQVIQRMSFDVWGERRAEGDWSPMSLTEIIAFNTDVTRKGYTGHEQVDQANLIHMGGRIYDPHIGRFLSADPLIQAPHLSQSYNRYSYVLNNPMNYVDPSGYSWISDNWRTIAAIAVAWAVPQLLPQLMPGIQAATAKVIAGMAAGAVQSGTLKGALIGGFSAGLFHGIGAHFDSMTMGPHQHATVLNTGLSPGQLATKIAAHAAAGGLMTVLQGGKFGHGFVSAGFGEAVSPLVMLNGGSGEQFVMGVVIGGTASKLAGGKFSNGAVTAAFQWGFNHIDLSMVPTPIQKHILDSGEILLEKLFGEVTQTGMEIEYDKVQVAIITVALNKLASVQGDDFLTSTYAGPERAMLLRVVTGMSDRFTLAWYWHEMAEANYLIEHFSAPKDKYLYLQDQAHKRTLERQGNSEYDLYHPSVMMNYPDQFDGPQWKRVYESWRVSGDE